MCADTTRYSVYLAGVLTVELHSISSELYNREVHIVQYQRKMTRCYGVLVTIVVLATNSKLIEAQSIAVNHELRQLFELCLGKNHLRTHVISDLHFCTCVRKDDTRDPNLFAML